MNENEDRGIQRLKSSIEAIKASIGSLNTAIAEQQGIVASYTQYLRDLETGSANGRPYTKEGLENGIEQAHGHIARLQIVKQEERDRIKRFTQMITDIQEQRKLKDAVVVNVEVEVEDGSQD